ncbi:MAG: hypothetical protein H7834_09845 [Magnetococcus sp. YQC-9]
MPWPDGWFLIPILPLLAALWIGIGMVTGGRVGEAGERGTARIALFATGSAFIGLVMLDLLAWFKGAPGLKSYHPWLTSGEFSITWNLLFDRPALVMATLSAASCLVTLRFSVDYLHREAGFHRFFAILSLFSGGMLLIALAGNLVLTFVGWEVAGLASYLLISYMRDRAIAAENATRAFVTNRFGDAGLLLAIALASMWGVGLDWPALFAASHQRHAPPVPIVAFGLVIAALAKSAQLPFSAWIARALEGPTPSSAVFYGTLMAHAGLYLILRIEPLLWHAPVLMLLMLLLGLLTAALAVAIGRVQSDVKSALIYSTLAQLGLMFAECGAGFFDLALWHLVAHASWRLYQFLFSPSYLHLGEGVLQPVSKWLAQSHDLHNLALNRAWLDALTDALITRPTLALARDARMFDELVVNRIAGRPLRETLLASRAEWNDFSAVTDGSGIGVTGGRGMLGRLLERTARIFSWVEEQFVLKSSGDGLVKTLSFLGNYLTRAEISLGQPRYLILMIVLTFLIIL